MKLLTDSNPKLQKGTQLGYLSFVLHLAPASLSGYNVCPAASDECTDLCLNTSGRGIMQPIQDARIRKTKWFFEDRESFMAQLVKDVEAGIRKAERLGLTPVFRLNGTSDIRWETVPCGSYDNIFQMFSNVQWYDYTKLANRRNIPANYHLTFSRSESNHDKLDEAIDNGMNVAVVFSTRKGAELPSRWGTRSLPVLDGDTTDLRFLDSKKSIVGLRAKGKAVGSTSGFVVQV